MRHHYDKTDQSLMKHSQYYSPVSVNTTDSPSAAAEMHKVLHLQHESSMEGVEMQQGGGDGVSIPEQ